MKKALIILIIIISILIILTIIYLLFPVCSGNKDLNFSHCDCAFHCAEKSISLNPELNIDCGQYCGWYKELKADIRIR